MKIVFGMGVFIVFSVSAALEVHGGRGYNIVLAEGRDLIPNIFDRTYGDFYDEDGPADLGQTNTTARGGASSEESVVVSREGVTEKSDDEKTDEEISQVDEAEGSDCESDVEEPTMEEDDDAKAIEEAALKSGRKSKLASKRKRNQGVDKERPPRQKPHSDLEDL